VAGVAGIDRQPEYGDHPGVHHLLPPSVDLRAVVGSHLAPNDPFDPSAQTSTNAYRRVLEVWFPVTPSDTVIRDVLREQDYLYTLITVTPDSSHSPVSQPN
jgi:hypothetical protein